MKIRMKEHANAASPEGSFKAGKEYEVKAEFGQALIQGGYAELVSYDEPVEPSEPVESDEDKTERATDIKEVEIAGKGKKK
jgi:hypothetical protein